MLKVNVHSIVFCFAWRFFASRHVASVLTIVKGQLLIKHLNKDLSESVSNSNSLTNWSVCKGKVKKVNHVFEQKRKGESLWSCRFFCLHFFLVFGGGKSQTCFTLLIFSLSVEPTSWNVIWVTRSIGLWVAVWLWQVSHWFVVILRRGQASTVLLGASAAVSG